MYEFYLGFGCQQWPHNQAIHTINRAGVVELEIHGADFLKTV